MSLMEEAERIYEDLDELGTGVKDRYEYDGYKKYTLQYGGLLRLVNSAAACCLMLDACMVLSQTTCAPCPGWKRLFTRGAQVVF